MPDFSQFVFIIVSLLTLITIYPCGIVRHFLDTWHFLYSTFFLQYLEIKMLKAHVNWISSALLAYLQPKK